MSDVNIKFKDNDISNSNILNGSTFNVNSPTYNNKGIIGDNNKFNGILGDSNNSNQINNSKKNENIYNEIELIQKISDGLDEIIITTKNKKEIRIAEKTKKYLKEKKFKVLKKWINKNWDTFITGTFSTVAGGMLLNLIQTLLNSKL